MALKGLDWHRREINACLSVPQIDGVVADIAPAEIEHFTPAASGERQQPDGGGGASKLTGNEMMAEAFANWGYAGWFMYVVGAVEIASVVAVLIPRIAALGGLWLGALMAGALARISSTPNMSNGSLRESCWGRP